MTSQPPSYRGFRFPPEIISRAVWLYHRFGLSFRDTEDLLAERGITVTYESIRRWCRTFGPRYARVLRKQRGRMGNTWHLDELFVTICGKRQYLWRAVDEDGDTIDILVQSRRNRRAESVKLTVPYGGLADGPLDVFAKYVVHPEHSEQNGVATHAFQTEEAPDEDSS